MDRLDQPHRRCSALGLDAPWGGTQGAPVRVTALWEGTGFLTSTCPLSHLGVGPHLLLHLLQSHCAAAQITEGLKSRAEQVLGSRFQPGACGMASPGCCLSRLPSALLTSLLPVMSGLTLLLAMLLLGELFAVLGLCLGFCWGVRRAIALQGPPMPAPLGACCTPQHCGSFPSLGGRKPPPHQISPPVDTTGILWGERVLEMPETVPVRLGNTDGFAQHGEEMPKPYQFSPRWWLGLGPGL